MSPSCQATYQEGLTILHFDVMKLMNGLENFEKQTVTISQIHSDSYCFVFLTKGKD
jgi:hypothetical protein